MKRRTPAFTLVELLVVMAIIAILFTLLLAALKYAKDSARLNQCMNNVTQISRGLHSFANRNKGYGPPGPPNAFYGSAPKHTNTADTKVIPPNTLWLSAPMEARVQVPIPLPRQVNGSRFNNHGYLWKTQEIKDAAAYYCPDMEGDPFIIDGLNGYDATIRPFDDPTLWDPATTTDLSPPGKRWNSSYDFRSCFDPGFARYDMTSSGSGDLVIVDYRGQNGYSPIDLGRRGAETPVLCDTMQNPGNVRIAHGNTRYNVAFADGHGSVVHDGGRVGQMGPGPGTTPGPSPQAGWNSIADMQLSVTTSDYWYWNERIWAEVMSKP